ncbi:hypothetical protein [Rahnella sp. PCH160]|uniref:nSTAND3 domain-containing NTPase n=1 Tax=Rahnella sp. PCH160 TaxID=3447928 RepID=UPI0039FD020B
MVYYDLSRLNDKEFEDLSIDLLKKILRLDVIERFRVGPDGGIDGRFFTTNGTVIIQCKHYIKSSYSSLLTTLRKEATKVSKLDPARYILMVSQKLSAKNKQDIIDIIGRQYLKEEDIFNIEEIAGYISENKDIELKYYKLWLHSTELLTSILHNEVIGNSKFILSQIKEKSDLYVQTADFENAIKKIEETKSIIITGDPGVGKTTLAEQLCLYYITLNYQLIYIENDISEAERIIDDELKQLFFFDDFLGRNYLDAILNKTDSRILQFIKRIRKLENKRFVLTSRTTILNQGKSASELFKIDNSHKHEYEVNLSSLDNLEKAKILYNHIWQSELPQEHKDIFWENKRYRNIITHKNFNPRLISFITDNDKICGLTPSQYVSHIIKSLNNPSEIWEHMFTRQLNHFVYMLTLITSMNNGNILEEDLRTAYHNYLESMNINTASANFMSFEDSIKLSLNSTLKKILNSGASYYDVGNPSISDYLIPKLNIDIKNSTYALSSLSTIASLKNFETLSSKHLQEKTISSIFEAIKNNLSKKPREYKLFFMELVVNCDRFSKNQKYSVANLINSGVISYDSTIDHFSLKLLKGINFLLRLKKNGVDKDATLKLIDLMLITSLGHNEICELGITLNHLGINDHRILQLRTELKKYWGNYIQDEINNNSSFEVYFEEESKSDIDQKAFEFLYETLDKSPFNFTEEEVEEILENFYSEEVISRNRESASELDSYYNPDSSRAFSTSFDAVDDLFSRD